MEVPQPQASVSSSASKDNTIIQVVRRIENNILNTLEARYRCLIQFYLYFYKAKCLEWVSTLKDHRPTIICIVVCIFLEKVTYIDLRDFCCYICSLQHILKTKYSCAHNVESTFFLISIPKTIAGRQESGWWGVRVHVAENITPHQACSLSQCDYRVFSQEQVEERRGGFQPDHEKRKIHWNRKTGWLS